MDRGTIAEGHLVGKHNRSVVVDLATANPQKLLDQVSPYFGMSLGAASVSVCLDGGQKQRASRRRD